MAGRHRAGSGRRGRFLRRALAVALPSLGVVGLAAVVVVGSLTTDRGTGRTAAPDATGPEAPRGPDRSRALTPPRAPAPAPASGWPGGAGHATHPVAAPRVPAPYGDSLLRLRLRMEQDSASERDVRAAGPALALLGR